MKIIMFVNVDWFYLSHRLVIAKEIDRLGNEIEVFCDFTKEYSNGQLRDFYMRNSPYRRRTKTPIKLIRELAKTFVLVWKKCPDIVHAVSIKPIILLGLCCFCLNIPFVASISGLGPIFDAKKNSQVVRLFLVKIVYKLIFLRKKVKVICQSQHDINFLVSNKIVTPDKLVLIESSGVDLSTFKQEQSNDAPMRVLMASRILSAKGIMEYIHAVGKIHRNFPGVVFNLAGPTDVDSESWISEEELYAVAAENGVNYLGNVTPLSAELNRSEIFVYPSYYAEGIPKVLVEASASGCAIITTDHPGCRDVVQQFNSGILVQPKSDEEVAEALSWLLTRPQEISKMGRAASVCAEERFNEKIVIDQHVEVYDSLHNDQ